MNITEGVRKYAADSSGANRNEMAIARPFPIRIPAGKKISRTLTRRASRTASQQGIAEEEALQKGLAEKSAELVENGAEVYKA